MWIKKNYDWILIIFGVILLFINLWLSNMYIRFIGHLCVMTSVAITLISVQKNARKIKKEEKYKEQ